MLSAAKHAMLNSDATKPDDTIRLAGVVEDSIVDGSGLRYAIFVQGCPHNCTGCHNPHTHDFAGGKDVTISSLLRQIEQNPLLTGVTFSGGEPFCQIEPLIKIAKFCHAHNLDVWCYTGYTLEELSANASIAVKTLLGEIDVLVDGKYREDLRDISLPFRGSSNQRLIDLKQTEKQQRIVLVSSTDDVNNT